MAIKKLFAVTAAGEAATGLALLIYPSLVTRLLFSADVSGAGAVMSRIAGISLIALGLACWPGGGPARALGGMSSYSLLTTLYLTYLGIGGEWSGTLLWPAVALHAVLTVLLARGWLDLR